MKRNQTGFSAVMALLMLVIVAAIIGAGYYVYQSRQDKSQGTSSTTEQNAEAPAQQPAHTEDEVMKIPELGVMFTLTDDLNGLYYVMGNSGKTAYFSLNDFKGTDCAADKTAQVALTKATEMELNDDPNGAAYKQSAVKIGEFYYYSGKGQAYCSDDQATQAKATKMAQDVQVVLKGHGNLQAIQ